MLNPSTSTFRKLILRIVRPLRGGWVRLPRRACHRVEDHLDDELGRGDQWHMVDLLRPDSCAHALRHKVLGNGADHPIFFGDEVPGRFYLPSGCRSLLLNAGDGDRPLCCGKKRDPFGGRVLRESGAKSAWRHPDKAM